jgi:hypothetical protein
MESIAFEWVVLRVRCVISIGSHRTIGTANSRHNPELTMAPKFQKGPDLKRFMVSLMLFNNPDVAKSKDWLSTRLAR